MKQPVRSLSICLSFTLLLLATSYAQLVFAQAETGTISGTVTDSTGSVVPNAKIEIRSVSTGAERSTVTDDRGFYRVSNLLPGLYSVVAQAPNLTKMEIRAEVTVGGHREVNFQLTVGLTTTVIEVVGEGGVQTNTETATLGTVIDNQQIQELPTLNRNPYTFAQYVGTASDGDPSGRGVGVAFNGLRSAGTNILLDGTANNNEFTAAVGQPIPLDSVQEYSVLTNNFTAEYGRASSAVVNLATKSGTNEFHGSAYEYNRVSAMSTQDFYDKANGNPKQHFTRNQFGGAVGGPIKKDKLFFFANGEWNRIRSASQQTDYVMDPAFVALAGSATQSYFSSLGKLRANARVLSTVPFDPKYCTGADQGTAAYNTAHGFATCAAVPAGTPFLDKVNYSVPADAGAGNPTNQALVVGRVDWNISEKTQLYGRYALDKDDRFSGVVSNSAYTGYDTGQNIIDNNFLLSVTHIFSPRWTMQNKVVFNRLNDFQPLGAAAVSPGLYFNPTSTTFFQGTSVMLPGYLSLTPGNGIPFGGPQNFLQYYQDWSHLMGRHTLRFGGSYDYQRDNRTFGAYETPVGSFSTAGGIADASLNRFLGGYWGQFQGAIYPQGHYPCAFSSVAGIGCVDNTTTPPTPHPEGNVTTPVSQPVFARSNRYHEFAGYLIDSWKVNSRLVLNLGLRYEYFGVQHNKNDQLDSNYYFSGGGSNEFQQIRNGAVLLAPDSPLGELWSPSDTNFAPKVGFAYDVSGNGKTVVRGGYSIAYERNFGNVTFNVIQNPPNYAVVSLQDGIDVSTGGLVVTNNPAGPLSGSGTVKALPKVSLRAVDPNIKQSYAHLYSLTLEHELRHNLLFGLDYSGSRGENLYDIANINRAGQGNVSLADPCTSVSSVDPVNSVTYTIPAYPCANSVKFNDGTAKGFTVSKNQLTRLRTTQYTNINFRGSNGISRYNALVARVQMNSFAKTGLTLNANYTYGHTLDELSDTFSGSVNQQNLGYLDAFNPGVDYGNSYLDTRHRFTAAAIWDVPFAKSTHGYVKQIADGWTVAPLMVFETGFPFSIYDCSHAVTVCMYAVNANGGINRSAPSSLIMTGKPDNFVYIPLYTNTDATGKPTPSSVALFDSSYVNPIAGISDFGPYPAAMNARNAFRGPGYWNLDFGIYKLFFLSERFRLQFRGELYNAFNHANLYVQSGDNNVSSISFVDAARGYNPQLTNPTVGSFRTVQLALRLMF
jgi:Carboxypeptidase regulatory-like domain